MPQKVQKVLLSQLSILLVQIASGWRHCGGVTNFGELYMWGWGGAEGTSSMLSVQHSSGMLHVSDLLAH